MFWTVTGKLRLSQVLLAAGLLASCGSRADLDPARPDADLRLAADTTTVEGFVPPNATLEGLFRDQQLPDEIAAPLVEAVRSVFNPRELRADQSYRITRSLDGIFREFRYDIDAERFLRVVFHDAPDAPATFDASVVPIPKEYSTAAVSVAITPDHSSLVDAFQAVGENIQLPLQLAQIFGGEVDFNTELRQGDRLNVLFERSVRNGEFVGYGDVTAAVLETGRKKVTAVRFTGADGKPDWFDAQGRSLNRQFLSSPLPFDPRVTSGFAAHRLHPIFGVERPHLGVDYGAPYGTSVNAVADGVVEIADWAGEAGRMVRLRHADGYETAYLHLSSFGPGVHTGARVRQGQLIGRVGETGAATGPHLDYRIVKNGVYVNPVTEFKKMPAGSRIAPEALPDFTRRRDDALAQLQVRLATPVPDVPARALLHP